MLLGGDKQEHAAATACEKAARLEPNDAMEALDAACAREQLEQGPPRLQPGSGLPQLVRPGRGP